MVVASPLLSWQRSGVALYREILAITRCPLVPFATGASDSHVTSNAPMKVEIRLSVETPEKREG